MKNFFSNLALISSPSLLVMALDMVIMTSSKAETGLTDGTPCVDIAVQSQCDLLYAILACI